MINQKKLTNSIVCFFSESWGRRSVRDEYLKSGRLWKNSSIALSEGGMGSVAGKISFKCEFCGSSLTGVGDVICFHPFIFFNQVFWISRQTLWKIEEVLLGIPRIRHCTCIDDIWIFTRFFMLKYIQVHTWSCFGSRRIKSCIYLKPRLF